MMILLFLLWLAFPVSTQADQMVTLQFPTAHDVGIIYYIEQSQWKSHSAHRKK